MFERIMRKPKPVKSADKSPTNRGSRRSTAVVLHLAGVVVFIGAIVFLTVVTKRYVDREMGTPDGPLKIAIKNKPEWMSDYLADQIAATVPRGSSSAFDHELVVGAVAKLQKNPWVRQVHQVRRVFGEQPGDTLEVDCEYRAPIALINSGESYWLVDNDGVKLPEQFAADELPKIMNGRDGRINLRVVEGVAKGPPAAGQKWPGQDLAAGLELVKLFYAKPYLDEITAINVKNFGGQVRRGDPQLVLETRYGTQIWWGRPINAKDFFVEVPVSRKLEILQATVAQRGRIDAGKPYFDVRYEDFLVPSDAAPAEAGTHESGTR